MILSFWDLWSWIPELLTTAEFFYQPGMLHCGLKIGQKVFLIFELMHLQCIFEKSVTIGNLLQQQCWRHLLSEICNLVIVCSYFGGAICWLKFATVQSAGRRMRGYLNSFKHQYIMFFFYFSIYPQYLLV